MNKQLKSQFSVVSEQRKEFSENRKYTCCLCCPRGVSNINMRLEKERYQGGDQLTLMASIDSSSLKNNIRGFKNQFNSEIQMNLGGTKHVIKSWKKIVSMEPVLAG